MRIRALALAGVSAILLTACGGGSSTDSAAAGSAAASSESVSKQSGPELAAAAADALEQAGAVRMRGQVPMDGDVMDVDLRLQGSDAAGSMGKGDQIVQLVVTGGAMYMQAAPEFWAAQGMPAGLAAEFADTWVLAPADAVGGLADFSLAGFVAELRQPSDGAYADEVQEGKLDGQGVWLVTQGDGSTLKIAADGTSYPLEGSLGGQTVTFSDFGVRTPIAAPADYLDLSQLAG